MKYIHRNQRKASLAAIAALLTTTLACGTDEPAEPSRPAFNVSFRWSADPGIDLESDGIKSIRAAIESNTVAEFLSLDYVYPGYDEASALQNLTNAAAYLDHPAVEGVGTAYLHIIANGEAFENQRYHVCKDMTGTARKINDSYPYPNPDKVDETFGAIMVSVPTNPIPLGKRSPRLEPTLSPSSPLLVPELPGRKSRPDETPFVLSTNMTYNPRKVTLDPSPCAPWFASRWGSREVPTPTRPVNQAPVVEPYYPGWDQ
ncbi:hypothetical protein [Nocardia asteroides]|uniref:hypothetical protein n=1 Tax=Nocardia asteroides TaxID=1824 RepID=UPI0033FB0FC6